MAPVPTSYDKTKHTVRAVISTEDGVQVWDWNYGYIKEHLMADGMEVPANGQVPLLDSHNRYTVESILGSARNFASVDRADVPGTKLKECDVEFSQAEEGMCAEQKMAEGHLTDFSVGYLSIESTFVPDKTNSVINGRTFTGPCLVTTRWMLKELSLTPIGADAMAKARSAALAPQIRQDLIARGMNPEATNEEAIQFMNQLSTSQPQGGNMFRTNRSIHMNPVSDPPAGGGAAPTVVNIGEVQRAERERVAGIHALSAQYHDRVAQMDDLKTKALGEGWTHERFSAEVLKNLSERSADVVPGRADSDALSIDAKDLRNYSLTRAINAIADGRKVDGLEAEITRHIAKVTKREDISARTILVPNDIFRARALTASSFTGGGALIASEVKAEELIELLRNKTYVEELGVRTITGLVGNVALPKITGGATVYWLAEGVAVTPSDQAFGQTAMTPKKMMVATAYDKQLLAQTSLGVENIVRDDIFRVMKIEKDRVALNGKGGGEPIGILNLTGRSTDVTFGAAATWAKILSFETNVATNNADSGSLGYITTPGSRGKWKSIQKASNLDFIWERGDVVNGYNARATNQVPSDKVIFGNWNDALFGEWAGIEITVDPYSLSLQDQMRIVINQKLDFVVRHPASFCVSTDSGAQ